MKNLGKISDSEAEILKVLWANGKPMTSRQIRDALANESGFNCNWQRTTVQTLIKRLVCKGALALNKQENNDIYCYTPLVTEEEFTSSRMEEFLNSIFGGNPKMLVAAMLNNNILSEDDMNEIKDHWQRQKEKDK